jgi:HK97 family phage major capsid protein
MMTKEKLAELQNQGQKAVDRAKAIAENAENANRAMSAGEQADYDREISCAKDLLTQIRSDKDDLAVMDKAREIGDAIGLGSLDGTPIGPTAKDASRRLSFKGKGATLARNMQPDGTKALSPSGAAVVAQDVAADPVALGQPALSLLDVIPVITHATQETSYLRQTTRTNNAAVVAAGALKPTSVYSVTRIGNTLSVIAHLSEGIPRHWLLDNASLERFLDNELRYGLAVAVEAKLLSDVNGTSGIQTLAYANQRLGGAQEGHHEVGVGLLHRRRVCAHPRRLGRRGTRFVDDEQH